MVRVVMDCGLWDGKGNRKHRFTGLRQSTVFYYATTVIDW
jgi:hypothetical protein